MTKTKYITSFTLIEIMVSIILFSIIIIFLYQTLDMTEKSNKFYSKKLQEQKAKTFLSELFFKDIAQALPLNQTKSGRLNDIGEDSQQKNFFWLETTHTYHNPFYTHIFYFVSKKNNLIRLESLSRFSTSGLDDEFFQTSYADIIVQDVTKFRVAKHKKSNKIAIYMQLHSKEDYIFSFAPMRGKIDSLSLQGTTSNQTTKPPSPSNNSNHMPSTP